MNEKELFIRIFWDWFDSLDRKSKEKFWYYSNDAAYVYFYNAVLPKIIQGHIEQNETRESVV